MSILNKCRQRSAHGHLLPRANNFRFRREQTRCALPAAARPGRVAAGRAPPQKRRTHSLPRFLSFPLASLWAPVDPTQGPSESDAFSVRGTAASGRILRGGSSDGHSRREMVWPLALHRAAASRSPRCPVRWKLAGTRQAEGSFHWKGRTLLQKPADRCNAKHTVLLFFS